MARRRQMPYPRMRKDWFGIPGISLAFTGSGTQIGGGLSFQQDATVLRMIGEYVIKTTSAPEVGDVARIACALGRVSTDAATVGATAVPDPNGEPQFPWLYWADHPFFFNATTQIGDDSLARVVRFDIRTKRKFDPSETLLWCVEYANISGDPPMQVILGQVRVLVALS